MTAHREVPMAIDKALRPCEKQARRFWLSWHGAATPPIFCWNGCEQHPTLRHSKFVRAPGRSCGGPSLPLSSMVRYAVWRRD